MQESCPFGSGLYFNGLAKAPWLVNAEVVRISDGSGGYQRLIHQGDPREGGDLTIEVYR